MYGDASDPTIATIDEALQANSIEVLLPLSDDNSAPVPIHPQNPSFRKFVAACNAEFPPPVVPVVAPSPAKNSRQNKRPFFGACRRHRTGRNTAVQQRDLLPLFPNCSRKRH